MQALILADIFYWFIWMIFSPSLTYWDWYRFLFLFLERSRLLFVSHNSWTSLSHPVYILHLRHQLHHPSLIWFTPRFSDILFQHPNLLTLDPVNIMYQHPNVIPLRQKHPHQWKVNLNVQNVQCLITYIYNYDFSFSLGLKYNSFIDLNMTCNCSIYLFVRPLITYIRKYGRRFASLSIQFIIFNAETELH